MPTRHRPPMRTLVAMLLALTLLLMLVVPYVDAAETIVLSKDVTLVSQTLDGTVLDAKSEATRTTKNVNVLLQRCTVQGAGLTVSGVVNYGAATWIAISLHILDTTVKDATLAFIEYLPDNSLVHIVNVTATMEGITPLFVLREFSTTTASMTIQRVRATWGTGDGGSVVQISGEMSLIVITDSMFFISDAVVTGAAHVLEITPECTAHICLFSRSAIAAFDLIEFRDARGAFVYSDTNSTAIGNTYYGMTRFTNITMTGGQPFFEARNGKEPAVCNTGYSSMVFSAISNDGPLFSLVPGADISGSPPNAAYSFRHINVASVISDPTSYTADVPKLYDATSDEAWNSYMGNITVAGNLMNTIDELGEHQLYATQLVGAYGEVIEVRQGGDWLQPSLRRAAAVNCLGDTAVIAGFVELVPGVQRAECNCPSNCNNTPYCTTVVDPLVYYDAYSPSPATCGVTNCHSCLFGQTSQCGACALGYGLTAALRCDRIPCNVANCNLCATDNVCGSCSDGYILSPDKTTCYASNTANCNIANCNSCTADGVCGSCGDGYSLSPDKTTCYASNTANCNIANCNSCTADGVCGSCGDGYVLSPDKTTCYASNTANCNIANCNSCTADGVCGSCEKGYKLKGTSECKKNGVGWWVWLIVGIVSAAVLAGIIVLLVCCLRRRKADESPSSMHASSSNAMRREQSDATEMQRYGSVMSIGAAPPNRSVPSGAYEWRFEDCNAGCSTQGSRASSGNPLDYAYW